MNDRFKFRVYFKGSDYAKAGYQDLTRKDVICSLNTNGVLIRDCIYECQQEGHEGSPCHMPFVQDNDMYVVQFCTGLKDKNGVLVYEGDIITRCNDKYSCNYEVIYDDDIFAFRLKNQGDKSGTLAMLKRVIDEYEVIGNIYENPELLEVGK